MIGTPFGVLLWYLLMQVKNWNEKLQHFFGPFVVNIAWMVFIIPVMVIIPILSSQRANDTEEYG